jgi:predicted ATPase
MAGPVFFDRSAVDALGMLDESDPSSATEIQNLLAEFKYFEAALCFPPWRDRAPASSWWPRPPT